MLSLRELLRELDVTVVAGEAGLDRAVRWVHISELDDPTPWLSGGELLLTTGLQLGDDAQQRAYVGRLSEHGLSGLGLNHDISARMMIANCKMKNNVLMKYSRKSMPVIAPI